MAKFRLGNEILESKYWEEEKRRACRLCRKEREAWEPVWEGCKEWREREGREVGRKYVRGF